MDNKKRKSEENESVIDVENFAAEKRLNTNDIFDEEDEDERIFNKLINDGTIDKMTNVQIDESSYWTPFSIKDIAVDLPVKPKLRPSSDHKIFFNIDTNSVPYPDEFKDRWHTNFVRMPCSKENTYKKDDTEFSSWSLIKKSLKNNITDSESFKNAILSYNPSSADYWNFEIIKDLLDEKKYLFEIIDKIANLVLFTDSIITKPIPLLRHNTTYTLTFNQNQLACILANAMFCTFPKRNRFSPDSEYRNFPAINFSTLLSSRKIERKGPKFRKKQKLLCLFEYFAAYFDKNTQGVVSFTRRSLNSPPDWRNSIKCISSCKVVSSVTGKIEDSGPNTIQADFANKFVGGGVLRAGCVQEEILFCLKPELLASLLFTEVLKDNDTLIIEGAERFSSYEGYASTFKFAEKYVEGEDSKCKRDQWGQWNNVITVIDATRFSSDAAQYTMENIERELNKAYCGFTDDLPPYRPLGNVIATGNWGCGAFGGNKELKFIIQLMACAECGKSMAYYTFGDETFRDRLLAVYEKLVNAGVSISSLWYCLMEYNSTHIRTDHKRGEGERIGLFDFILS